MAGKTGIVSAIGPARDAGIAYGLAGTIPAQRTSISELALYDKVDVTGDAVVRVSAATHRAYSYALAKTVKSLRIPDNAKKIHLAGKPYSARAKLLVPKLLATATALAKTIASGAPVTVRFHNDGDGASGAVALYRAITRIAESLGIAEPAVTWRMNRRIAYGPDELNEDRMFFSSWKSAEKPLLLITDFGTSPDSVRSLKALHESADIIMLDHHPPYKGFPRSAVSRYVNGWDLGADSDFTAGLLSCFVAEILAGVDVEDMKAASLVSDYSTYADVHDSKASKAALILDFLTASRTQVKPSGIDAVLLDRDRFNDTYLRAKSMQEDAVSTALKSMKSYRSKSGITVCVLDFSHIAKLSLEFPPPGRLSSILHRELESRSDGDIVTIVHSRSRISVRLSEGAAKKADMIKIIGRIQKSSSFELSGGGHEKAVGISSDSAHIGDIVNSLLLELGAGR